VRIAFIVITIASALVFGAAAAWFVAGIFHNLSSGWTDAGRWTLGAVIGAALQAGLIISAFQRTPSPGKRTVLIAAMLPSTMVFFTIVRSADLTSQEQVAVMIAAAYGLLVYAVAIVRMATRPYR
jgi:hypothetical protein